jgi:hypothetical protein
MASNGVKHFQFTLRIPLCRGKGEMLWSLPEGLASYSAHPKTKVRYGLKPRQFQFWGYCPLTPCTRASGRLYPATAPHPEHFMRRWTVGTASWSGNGSCCVSTYRTRQHLVQPTSSSVPCRRRSPIVTGHVILALFSIGGWHGLEKKSCCSGGYLGRVRHRSHSDLPLYVPLKSVPTACSEKQ